MDHQDVQHCVSNFYNVVHSGQVSDLHSSGLLVCEPAALGFSCNSLFLQSWNDRPCDNGLIRITSVVVQIIPRIFETA